MNLLYFLYECIVYFWHDLFICVYLNMNIFWAIFLFLSIDFNVFNDEAKHEWSNPYTNFDIQLCKSRYITECYLHLQMIYSYFYCRHESYLTGGFSLQQSVSQTFQKTSGIGVSSTVLSTRKVYITQVKYKSCRMCDLLLNNHVCEQA